MKKEAGARAKLNIVLINAVILAACSIVAKVIGAFYRIPLTNILGTEGMGLYQSVFPFYAFLLVVLTSGVPVALAKKVAENEESAQVYLRVCIKFILLLSLIFAGVTCAAAPLISRLQGAGNTRLLYLVISPCFIFAGLIGIMRGFYQGRQKMLLPGLSQILEQIVKLTAGIVLAKMLLKHGLIYGVLGAVIGVTLSELIAFIFIFLCFLFTKKNKKGAAVAASETAQITSKTAARQILAISARVTLNAAIVPFLFVVDSFIIINALKKAGLAAQAATSQYGSLYGVVNSLVNMPVVVVVALASAIMPAISKLNKTANCAEVNKKVALAMKLTALIGLPCFIVFVAMPREIYAFLYQSGGAEAALTARLIMFSAINVLLIAMLSIFSSILYGLNKFSTPLVCMLFAAALKIILTIILVKMRALGIYGAVIANVAFYLTAAVLNYVQIRRICKIKIKAVPLIYAAVTASAMFGLIKLFARAFTRLSPNLHTLLTIGAAGLVYLVLITVFGLLRLKELK